MQGRIPPFLMRGHREAVAIGQGKDRGQENPFWMSRAESYCWGCGKSKGHKIGCPNWKGV